MVRRSGKPRKESRSDRVIDEVENGVDVVLQAVAMYKSRDPRSLDEEEMVENLFDCLCCLLMPLENKERFLKAEGVELMIIIMNQKKLCNGSAIKALDFAMTNYPPACGRFVDIPTTKNKKISKEVLEARLISLVASLFDLWCVFPNPVCRGSSMAHRVDLVRLRMMKPYLLTFLPA
ncbi:hypothetical protein L2E82_13069 [Cichorium intybus]|uniref:Uncharacterized protein n=1 Tax=Cichorium intybus TaxID=13427 RepID=A0ACB9GHQ9_CICIN|nr:hypothetical protein L2E82_13069 [Cichorium intybus]